MSAKAVGQLVLVPNALDLGATQPKALADVLPRSAIAHAARLQHWVVEDAKSARAFLKRVGEVQPLVAPIQALQIVELPRPVKGDARGNARGDARGDANKFANPASNPHAAGTWEALLQPALQGHEVGLLSEAGLPAVADPGSALVAAAHAAGVPVLTLPGASSITLAVAASGLQGQCFAFVGYLPQEAQARHARLQELQQHSKRWQQTQVVIETPYRNEALFQALVQSLSPSTRLHISVGLSLADACSFTATVAQWRLKPFDWQGRKTPTVFAFLA